jgi:hypothetical protein
MPERVHGFKYVRRAVDARAVAAPPDGRRWGQPVVSGESVPPPIGIAPGPFYCLR